MIGGGDVGVEKKRIKFPCIYHLPFSNTTNDDKMALRMDLYAMYNMPIVVTEKMDGSNISIYPDGFLHARSTEFPKSAHYSWIKQKSWNMSRPLEQDMRVSGEYMYAKHSIHYTNLEDFFYVHTLWGMNYCLGWNITVNMARKIGVPHVPVLYKGMFDLEVLENIARAQNPETTEGFVVRPLQGFHIDIFPQVVFKYVRANHVQTDIHWTKTWIKNERRLSDDG